MDAADILALVAVLGTWIIIIVFRCFGEDTSSP